MDYSALIERVLLQFDKKLPFVVFSLANGEVVKAFFQNNDELYKDENLSRNGFVMHQFFDNNLNLLIPEDDSETIQSAMKFSELAKDQVEFSEPESDLIFHESLTQKTIEAIKQGQAEKIVVSRRKDFKMDNFSIEILIERMFSTYPSAFRYVWFHPKTGIWCGATPETLVEIRNNQFRTMALAGTKPYSAEPIKWREKELAEQHFVTQAILENLTDIVQDINVSETHNHRAGNLVHLRTDISGMLSTVEGSLSKLADILHPTPAVCGTPKEFAKNFIFHNENYDREFYTGFLGPIEDDGRTATLMVNLRCMKIQNGKASIFMGGGITVDSDPAEEWVETQNKMQTMLQVLEPML